MAEALSLVSSWVGGAEGSGSNGQADMPVGQDAKEELLMIALAAPPQRRRRPRPGKGGAALAGAAERRRPCDQMAGDAPTRPSCERQMRTTKKTNEQNPHAVTQQMRARRRATYTGCHLTHGTATHVALDANRSVDIRV